MAKGLARHWRRSQRSSARRRRRPCATWRRRRCWSPRQPGGGAKAVARIIVPIAPRRRRRKAAAPSSRSSRRARLLKTHRGRPIASLREPIEPIMSSELLCPDAFLSPLEIDEAVTRALAEDLGRAGDITSIATIPENAKARAVVVARKAGTIAGLP